MYTKDHLAYRILVAKTLHALYFEPRNASRCFRRIHKLYILPLVGVEYDSARSYVKTPEQQLQGIQLPHYLKVMLQLMSYLHECDKLGILKLTPGRRTPEELDAFLMKLAVQRAALQAAAPHRITQSAPEKVPEELF